MKKFLSILAMSLLFFSNVNAEERDLELNKLFNQLKNNNNASMAFEIEKKYGKFGRSILLIIGKATG